MNKTKMIFMQNAPKFVIAGGFGSLVIFALCGLLICFTDEWKFGVYVILLCIVAISFLIYAIHRFEKIYKMPISDVMTKNKKYWEEHDK